MTERIAIIGSGLAGIAAARTLRAAGREVLLLDKGRAPGGRLATRRTEVEGTRLQWDHGAQYLRARGPGFAAALAEAGAAPWPDAQRRVGVPGMSAVPRALAAGLPIRLGRHAGALSGGPGAWTIAHWDAAEARPGAPLPASAPVHEGPFAAVILAMPAPQAMDLFAQHWASGAAALAGIRHAPCWTVMAGFATPPALPDILRPGGEEIGWAAHEGAKPGRAEGAGCWVIQATPVFTRRHLEAPGEAVIEMLLTALGRHAAAPLPALRHARAHRWRYALVEQGLGTPCLWDAGLGLGVAGDGCPGGHAEAAWDSGTAAALACLAG